MIRHTITLLLFCLTLSSAYGQVNKTCDCPQSPFAGIKADTVFQLSGGTTIAVCGYKNRDNHPTSQSEFILVVCGQDTIIDFWGAVKTCRLSVNKDTLLVDQLQYHPIGINFKYEEVVWVKEKIYFNGKILVRRIAVNRQVRKYSKSEIQNVLKLTKQQSLTLKKRK